jgi:FkbM family methyltransferase
MAIFNAIAARRAARSKYERDVAVALARLVRPGSICVDAGAHQGTFALLMARLAGRHGHVYAFEPHPLNAARVRRAVRWRGLERRVTVEQAALLDRGGDAELFPGRRPYATTEWTVDLGFAAREDTAPVERPPIVVRALALDEYLPAGRRIDVVKVDVEGAEARALGGMRRILKDSAPAILLEFHREVGWPAIGLLEELGYELLDLDGEPLPPLEGPDAVPYHLLALRR